MQGGEGEGVAEGGGGEGGDVEDVLEAQALEVCEGSTRWSASVRWE